MGKLSRRELLKRASKVAGGLVAFPAPPGLVPLSSELHLDFPTKPRERLAVASWPFRAEIDSPTNPWAKRPAKDLKDFAALIAKRFNVRNIEPLGQHFRSTEPAYLAKFREAVEKAGCHVVNIPTGVRESFYDPDPGKRANAVEEARKWVDVALAVGSPGIRMHVGGPPNVKPDAEKTAESLKALAEYGAEKNVLVNLENDDNYTEDPFFLVEVIEKVNSPYLRALPDFCNSMLTHNQDFNNRALQAMFRHTYNISHMKDSEVGDDGKLYTVDVAKCFEIAKAAGFRGYFSMEWEGQGGPYEGTEKLIQLSLKYL